jgi:hypothetical protein
MVSLAAARGQRNFLLAGQHVRSGGFGTVEVFGSACVDMPSAGLCVGITHGSRSHLS